MKCFSFICLFCLLVSCDFVTGSFDKVITETLTTYTMEPLNKYGKDYKLDRRNKKPKRFDVVEFDYTDQFYDSNDFYSDKRHVSRVIGLPEEDIEIRKGIVFINGVKLEEPFLLDSLRSDDDMSKMHLKEKEYFVMVDCRKMIFQDSTTLDVEHKAYDSRKIGIVRGGLIAGITSLK